MALNDDDQREVTGAMFWLAVALVALACGAMLAPLLAWGR